MTLPTKAKVPAACSMLGGKVYKRSYSTEAFGLKLMRAGCFGINEDDSALWACLEGAKTLKDSRNEKDGIEMRGQVCSMIREDEDEAKRVRDADWSDETIANFCRSTYFAMAESNQNGMEGIQQLEQMCWKQKDENACFKMAIIFRDGHTYEVNHKRSVEFFDLGCRYGSTASCNSAGFAYGNGTGVKKSGAKELSYFKKACALKLPVGCYNVGISYLNGDGISKNHAAAYDHMLKACRLGYNEGCDRLRTDCNYHSSPTACSRWKRYNSRR
jgi:TPR repeat protein